MVVLGIRAARMHDTTRRIERRLARAGVRVTAEQLERLADYLLLLDRWNRRMNLTALDDPDEVVDRLLVEPVAAAGHIKDGARVLVDVGSGGGSPAIPLKVMRPELSLTMIEVKTRKSVFLREVARHLGLASTVVETARFEDVLRRPEYAGAIDAISIRAVRVQFEELRQFGAVLKEGGQQLWFLSGAQSLPVLPSELNLESDIPLVESTRSRLVVVRRI